jgi:hypothetical protein
MKAFIALLLLATTIETARADCVRDDNSIADFIGRLGGILPPSPRADAEKNYNCAVQSFQQCVAARGAANCQGELAVLNAATAVLAATPTHPPPSTNVYINR